ncbi:unnamed protein product [Arctogadus glacialis]
MLDVCWWSGPRRWDPGGREQSQCVSLKTHCGGGIKSIIESLHLLGPLRDLPLSPLRGRRHGSGCGTGMTVPVSCVDLDPGPADGCVRPLDETYRLRSSSRPWQ